MTIAAISLLVLWIAAVLLLRSRPVSAPAPARRRNAVFLLLTVLTAYTTCAAPVVKLVAGFREVAGVAPENRAAFLERRIAATRPTMLLSVATLPVLVLGIAAVVADRRRIRRRERDQAIAETFWCRDPGEVSPRTEPGERGASS